MKKYILFTLLLTVLLGCGESQEEKDRNIKKKIYIAAGSPCLKFTATPKENNLTFLDADLENGQKWQGMMKQNEKGEIELVETINSKIGRLIIADLKQPLRSVALQESQNQFFQGEAVLNSGEKLKILAHYQNGWYPQNDKNTLLTLMKYKMPQDKVNEGKELKIDSIAMETLSDSTYEGAYKDTKGNLQHFSVIYGSQGFNWFYFQKK